MPDERAPDLWPTIDALWAWVEANNPQLPDDNHSQLLLRILKLSEEVGETAQAVIGATGQNPRKGITHTWDDVQAELCDVAVTALVALRTLTPDAQEVFARHLTRVTARSLSSGSPLTAGKPLPTGNPLPAESPLSTGNPPPSATPDHPHPIHPSGG